MFVPAAVIPLAFTLIAATANIVGQGQDRYRSCVEGENRTRDNLAEQWATFPAADRAYCVAAIRGFEPTYTELLTCLEMARDVKKLPRE